MSDDILPFIQRHNGSITARKPVKHKKTDRLYCCPVCKAIVGTRIDSSDIVWIMDLERCPVCDCELNWEEI